MEKTTYNGWTNYETWVVALWVDNEQESYGLARRKAKRELWTPSYKSGVLTPRECAVIGLAEKMKAEYEEAMHMTLERAGAEASVWADLLGAALSDVNWGEIAEHLIAEVE